MNLQDFEKLAALAQQASPGRVDVEYAVLRRLAAQRAQPATAVEPARLWSSIFAWLAGAAAVAASFGAALALQAWFSLSNPLAALLNSFVVMIP